MDNENRPTVIGEIDLPVEMVELDHLRTKDGKPVRVQCESISELKLVEILKALPGDRPPVTPDTDAEPDAEQLVRAIDRFGPQIIEAGTMLLADDGREVRPAFWFTAPAEGAIPGRLLHEEDKIKMVHSILRRGGYLGGAAGAGFPGGERGRSDSGLGAMAPGTGHGRAAAPAAQPGTQPTAGAGV